MKAHYNCGKTRLIGEKKLYARLKVLLRYLKINTFSVFYQPM
jgi:hypothetical protein